MTVTNNNNNNENFNATRDFDLKKVSVQQRPAENARPVRTVGGQNAQQSGTQRPAQYGVRQQSPAKPNPARQMRPQQAQTAGQPQRQVRQVRPAAPTQDIDLKKTQTPAVNGKMMQTRVAPDDLAEKIKKEKTKRDNAEKQVKKDKKKERSEGTNTVVSIVKAVIYIMFVIVVAVFLAIGIIKIGNDVFAFVKSDELIEVTIPEGADTEEIGQILADNNVISYPKVFSVYSSTFRHYDDNYIAGTYTVSPSMSFDALVAEFKPKVVYGTCEITIPEGFTTDEIIDLMVENGIGTREGYVDVIENGDFDYWFIKELEENGVSDDRIYRLDGYLFPDTYEFYLTSSEWTVINKLLKRFSQIFTREYRDQCDAFGYTVDEVVTLASIIEKEAASPSEFFLVSSVFHNRLNAWQSYPRFESDATVVYVIQHETGERNVDLDYDTPYNTYKYDGFPPGPISNPSASAMLAALSPQNSNYYFFISNNGTTYFTATKAEHDALIEKFRNESDQQIPAGVPQN